MAVPQRVSEEFNKSYATNDIAANDPQYDKKRAVDPTKYGAAANDPVYTFRRPNSDRSDLLPAKKLTRNVQVTMRNSTMPGSPANEVINPSRKDIASDYRENAYRDKTIRPTTLDERPLPGQQKDSTRNTQVVVAAMSQNSTRTTTTEEDLRTVSKKKEKKKLGLARLRATTVNIAILAWAGWLWLVFQVPLGILNLVFFGISAGLDALSVKKPEDGTLVSMAKAAWATTVEVAGWIRDGILALTGYDLSWVNPGTFWMITELVMICYGIFVLLIIYFQYTTAFLHPLSGNAAGAKLGAFIFAFIGYMVPVLNLFPVFMLWTTVVWLKPK